MFHKHSSEVEEESLLGKTQSTKFYISTLRSKQNGSLNLSTPKNIKLLPKLQKSFLFPVYKPRYIFTPSNQSTIIKYKFSQQKQAGQNRNIFFRSEKSRRNQRLNDTKVQSTQLNITSAIQKEKYPKFYVQNRKGKRPYNQDRYLCKNGIHKFYLKNHLKNQNQKQQEIDLYSVFDGHGGAGCADYLKDNFLNFLVRTKNLNTNPQQSLKQAFTVSEEKFINLCEAKRFNTQTSGACAVSCIVTSNKIIVGSVGDCRAIMFNKQYLCQMTKDHKPTEINEKMRIIKSGGKIFKEQIKLSYISGSNAKIITSTRIAPGNLNVSRTIGDIQTKLKKYGGLPGMISAQPEIKTFQKQNYQILLLASDGLFQAFSNSQIQKFYYKVCQTQLKSGKKAGDMAKIFIEKLMQSALQKSTDNITIIVVPLLVNSQEKFY